MSVTPRFTLLSRPWGKLGSPRSPHLGWRHGRAPDAMTSATPIPADRADHDARVGETSGECPTQVVVVDLDGRGSHPHRAEVGLNYLWLHGIPGGAAAVIPVELMAWTHAMAQRPALVVVRAASADCVSGIHVLDPRSKGASDSGERTILVGNKQNHATSAPCAVGTITPGRRRRYVLQGIANADEPGRISGHTASPASLSPRCAVSSIGRAADS